MKSIRFPFALAALTATTALVGCEATPTETPGVLDGLLADHTAHAASQSPAAAPPAHGAPDLAMIRAGSAPYRNETRAVAAGFVDVSGCVQAPPIPDFPYSGAMGHHYVNFDRLEEISVDPSRPEILLYIPNAQGRMELVGVEFAVNAEAWHAIHGAEVYPEVAGKSFDPPNPGADSPIVQTSYTLHVWNWVENPDGMFVPFNPALSCPAAED